MTLMSSTTSSPLNLIALVGSLRVASLHRTLFNAAQELVPEGVVLTEVPLSDVPLYNGDIEDAGDPAAVRHLKDAVAAADGIVIFTPEYNRSIPAVTKNAIDWASRTPGASAIGGKPVASVSASPGGHEVEGVRAALAATLAGARARPFAKSVGLANGFSLLEDGRLADPVARTTLAEYLAEFSEFVRTEALTVSA